MSQLLTFIEAGSLEGCLCTDRQFMFTGNLGKFFSFFFFPTGPKSLLCGPDYGMKKNRPLKVHGEGRCALAAKTEQERGKRQRGWK